MDLSLPAFLGMAAVVFTAYTVFGLTGFGSGIIAVPVLVQIVPLSFAVPMVLLLDLAATMTVGLSNRRLVSRPEMRRLLPFLLLGVAVGVTALVGVPARWLLLSLGVFVLANASWSLLAPSPKGPVGTGWAVPAGIVGGIASALFGTGGPIYTVYLAGRLADPAVLRATISAVTLVTAVVRLVAFTAAGLLLQPGLLASSLLLLPFCAAGVFTGSRLRGSVPPGRLRQALFAVLVLGGAGVVARALAL